MATTTQNKTVIAVFDRMEDAQRALQELTNAGISRDDISLIAHNRSGQTGSVTGTTGTEKTTDGTTVGENVAGGALFGGIGGLLIGIAALAIPGVGPVLAAGPLSAPLAAALGGVLTGAVGGGIIGVLKDAGVPDDEASIYAESLRRGSTLISVSTDDAHTDRVCDILDRNGAVDVDERRNQYQNSGWSGFTPDAGEYTPDASSMSSGTTSTSTEQTNLERNRRVTRAYPSTGFFWNDDDYRKHYQSNYGSSGGSYDNYASAYQYGSRLQSDARYQGRNWEDIEDTIRTDYLRNNPNSTWDQAKGAVRYGWERMTGQRSEDPSGVTHGTRNMDLNPFDDDWRTHYSSHYGTSGSSGYENYRPAYDYGSRMGSDTRDHGRTWEDVEDTLRTDYLRNNPNSTWDNVKGAVRYGWEKVAGKR